MKAFACECYEFASLVEVVNADYYCFYCLSLCYDFVLSSYVGRILFFVVCLLVLVY